MVIKSLPFILILALSWTACKNDAPQSGTAPADSATTDAAAPAPAPTDAAAPVSATPGATLSGAAPAGAAPSSMPQAQPAATGTTAAQGSGKVNPPHGQPGHRCDIAVGAPLDSAPAASKTATTAKAAPSTTISTKPAASPAGSAATVAPGTNPPHGQPGHRCDIAVGAPLDSKPKPKQ